MAMTIPQLARNIHTVLTDVAQQAVDAAGFCQRRSPLGDARFVQTLVLTCLAEPQPTLDDYAQTAAAAHTPVSPQAFDQRFGPAAVACLQSTLQHLIRDHVLSQPTCELLQRFHGVHLQDASFITLPDEARNYYQGFSQAGERSLLKIQVRLNLANGQLTGPLAEDGIVGDTQTPLSTDDLPAGSLYVADRGYFSLDHLRDLSARGVYWLSEYQRPTAVFIEHKEINLLSYLRQQERLSKPHIDVAVTLGKTHQLPCRLLAWRVKPEVANRRRQRLRKKAADEGRQVSAERLTLCDWTICLTTIPNEKASVQEVAVLLRARWQVEILFRVWKSGGKIDESRSNKAARMTCEVLAKLIAEVLSHWVLVVAGWQQPDRSWWKAAKAIRRSASDWIVALEELANLIESLKIIRRKLERAGRMEKRRARPATYQRLTNPGCVDLGDL